MNGTIMHENVRPSLLAGTAWYPGDPKILRKTINQYFDQVQLPPVQGRVLGVISPHAGFEFSGQVAAHGYKAVSKFKYDQVVIISPLHRLFSNRYVTSTAAFYETPLGKVPVDQNALKTLSEIIRIEPVLFDNEHSLEIQLPFLQVILKEFKLIPIMVGVRDIDSCEDIVAGLIKICKKKKTLFVASSDMHHIANYDEVVQHDKKVVDALMDFDLKKIRQVLKPKDCTVCGKTPISIVLDITKRLGATQIHILSHTNSGNITGEKQPGQYTVGYVSAIMV
jgi:AmmeMemoRadiSam system protein B